MTNSIAHDLSVMGIHTCAYLSYVAYQTCYVGKSISHLPCADGRSMRVHVRLTIVVSRQILRVRQQIGS